MTPNLVRILCIASIPICIIVIGICLVQYAYDMQPDVFCLILVLVLTMVIVACLVKLTPHNGTGGPRIKLFD